MSALPALRFPPDYRLRLSVCSSTIVSMNRLDETTRARILSCLVEGMGIRPTARATGVAINSVQALIREMGPVCRDVHDITVLGLACKRVECDEAWAFNYCRAKHVKHAKAAPEGAGDVWTWTAICAETKIIPAWYVGGRDRTSGMRLLGDLAKRVTGRIEINTDGYQGYGDGVALMLAKGLAVDWAKVIKHFATPNGEWNSKDNRYQQPKVTGITREAVCGSPDVENASTSYAERMNLSLRMHNKKLSRLSNGHAKRLEMLRHSLDIYYTFYNFCRPHEALGGRTPAQANGLTDRRWTALDLVRLAK